MPHQSIVYFIQSETGGAVKIGKSTDPQRRLRTLQTGHPGRLMLLGTTTEFSERELHSRFAHCCANGEWFNLSPALISFLCSHVIATPPTAARTARCPPTRAAREDRIPEAISKLPRSYDWYPRSSLPNLYKKLRSRIDPRGHSSGKSAEETAAVRRVRSFLGHYGASRFAEIRATTTESADTGFVADLGPTPADSAMDDIDYAENPSAKTHARAGWRRLSKSGTVEFLILPDSWCQEICAGMDPIMVAKALLARGFLEKGEGRNLPKKVRIPEYGTNAIRCFVVGGQILAGSD